MKKELSTQKDISPHAVQKRLGETALGIAKNNAQTIATLGIDPAKFAITVQEAIRRVPNIYTAKQDSFVNAVRACCRDGLVPDGRRAVFYVTSSGEVTYLPMKEGLMHLVHTALNAEIKSGHVCEQDEIKVEIQTGEDDKITVVKRNHFGDRGKIIGAWAWIKIPGQNALCHTLNRADIDMAKSKSAKKFGGPWQDFEGSMAEKSAIKALINRVRYLLQDNSKSNHLSNVLDHDSDFQDAEIIDIDVPAEDVIEVKDTVQKSAPEMIPAKNKAPKQVKKATEIEALEPAPEIIVNDNEQAPVDLFDVDSDDKEDSNPFSSTEF